MLKKLMMALALAAVAGFAAGCASVQTADELGKQKISSDDKNVAHLYASNWGVYCFTVPFLTGSSEKPGDVEFGKDTVNPKSVVKMLTKKSDELGATKTLNLDTKTSSFWIFPTMVLFYREVQVSGNAVK